MLPRVKNNNNNNNNNNNKPICNAPDASVTDPEARVRVDSPTSLC